MVRIDDAMRVYERGVKRIDKRLSGSGNESKLENRIKRLERLMRNNIAHNIIIIKSIIL